MSMQPVGVQAVFLGLAAYQAAANSFVATNARLTGSTTAMGGAARYPYLSFVALEQAMRGNIGTSVALSSAIGKTSLVYLGLAAGLVAVSAASSKLAADLQETLVFTTSIVGGTNEQMEQLGGTIVEMSRSSTQSVAELSEGVLGLVRAGLDLPQIGEGALKAANNLAIASKGELDMAAASEIVARGLTAFSLSGEHAAEVADAVTLSAQRSNQAFSDFRTVLQYAAPLFNNLGMSVDDLAIGFTLLGRNAITGSVAATSLRNVVSRLITPTKEAAELIEHYGLEIFDAQGHTKSFPAILDQLNRAFGDQAIAARRLTEKQREQALGTIFQERTLAAAIVLSREGAEGYNELAAALENEINTERLAATMMLPLNAQLELAGNNVGALATSFGQELLPVFQPTIQGFIDLLKSIPTEAMHTFGNTVARSMQLAGMAFEILLEIGNNAMMLVSKSVATAGQIISEIWSHLSDLLPKIWTTAWNNLGEIVASAANLISALFTAFVNANGAAWVRLTNSLPEGWHKAWTSVGGIVSRALQFVGNKITEFVNWLRTVPVIGEGIEGAINFVSGAISGIPGAATSAWESVTKGAEITWESLKESSKNIISFETNAWTDMAGKISTAWEEAGRRIDAARLRIPEGMGGARRTGPGIDEGGPLGMGGGGGGGAGGSGREDPFAQALKQLLELERDWVDKLREIHDEANEANAKSVAKFLERTADAQKKAVEQEKEAIEALDLERVTRGRKESLDKELDEAALRRERALEDIERWNEKQLDAARRTREQLAEGEERAFKEEQDEEERRQEKRQDAEEAAMEKRHDAATRALEDRFTKEDALFEKEQDKRQRSVDLTEEKLQASTGFSEALLEAAPTEQTAPVTAAFEATLKSLYSGLGAGTLSIDQFNAKLLEAEKKRQADLTKLVTKEESDRIKAEYDANVLGIERESVLDEARLRLKEQQEKESLERRTKQEAEELRLRTTQDSEALALKNHHEQENFELRKEQETAFREWRLEQEESERIQRALEEEAAFLDKRKREDDDRKFKAGQDAQRRALDETLEKESLDRRIAAIRINLLEREQELKDELAKELKETVRVTDEKLAAIQTAMNDKLPEILEKAGTAIQTEITRIEDAIVDSMIAIADAARDAAMAIASVTGASVDFGVNEGPASEPAGEPELSEGWSGQRGGVVPGAFGRKVRIWAHGGERFAGLHGESSHLLGPRMLTRALLAEVGARAAATSITNNYNYNVDANYGNSQSPASVAMDLRAIIAVSKR